MDSMNITSAQYFSDEGINLAVLCVINGQELSVPLDPDNRHYQAIQEWVAEGNTIQPAE